MKVHRQKHKGYGVQGLYACNALLSKAEEGVPPLTCVGGMLLLLKFISGCGWECCGEVGVNQSTNVCVICGNTARVLASAVCMPKACEIP